MSTLSIKVGQVSFEWETDLQLTVEDVNQLLDRIEALPGSATSVSSIATTKSPTSEAHADGGIPNPPNLHINSLASTLSSSTGSDLAVAAAAFLQIVQQKASFSRQELLAAMKEATKFYNANMSSNLSKILNGLVGSRLNQVGQNQYSLSAAEFTKLEAQLAQSG